jgi:hypothetical protein
VCDLYRDVSRIRGSIADILLGTLTRMGKDTRGNVVHFPARERDLHLLHYVDTGPDMELYIRWLTLFPYPGVKRPGPDADH